MFNPVACTLVVSFKLQLNSHLSTQGIAANPHDAFLPVATGLSTFRQSRVSVAEAFQLILSALVL